MLACLPAYMCRSLTLRRKLQRSDRRRVLVLEETALRLSAASTHAVVLPGEEAYVVATDFCLRRALQHGRRVHCRGHALP